LPFGIEDPHLRNANLTIGARASGGRWARDELWTWNLRFSLLNCSDTPNCPKCKAFCGWAHGQFGGIPRHGDARVTVERGSCYYLHLRVLRPPFLGSAA
jgi:hypothetical protein